MRTRCMKKRFVFLLQRFSIVVQEREYSRIRGFHLLLKASVLREKTCIRTSDGLVASNGSNSSFWACPKLGYVDERHIKQESDDQAI